MSSKALDITITILFKVIILCEILNRVLFTAFVLFATFYLVMVPLICYFSNEADGVPEFKNCCVVTYCSQLNNDLALTLE